MLAAVVVLAVLFVSGAPIAYCLDARPRRVGAIHVRVARDRLARAGDDRDRGGARCHQYSLATLAVTTIVLGCCRRRRRVEARDTRSAPARPRPAADRRRPGRGRPRAPPAPVLFRVQRRRHGRLRQRREPDRLGRGDRPPPAGIHGVHGGHQRPARRGANGERPPAIGIMLLLGTVALGKLIGLRTAAVAVVGAIVVVHPVTVWFSLFPVSEVPYAVTAARGAVLPRAGPRRALGRVRRRESASSSAR